MADKSPSNHLQLKFRRQLVQEAKLTSEPGGLFQLCLIVEGFGKHPFRFHLPLDIADNLEFQLKIETRVENRCICKPDLPVEANCPKHGDTNGA